MMRRLAAVCLFLACSLSLAAEPAPRKIVLIAGKKSHGPNAHDYERTMRLFKVMLDNSSVADRVRVEVHENGWPADEKTLDDADTIAFYSDGRDGDKFSDAPFVVGDRMKVIQKQIDRGCGFMTMHFSTFVTDEQGKSVLQWNGGYFDWQDDAGKQSWYSKISQIETLELASRDHPISRGVPRMVQLRDEVYWKLRFLPDDKRLTPIWKAIDVKDSDPTASTVGWAVERKDGGRGFGTSVGHAYRLWQDDGVRKLFLNAILWTAKAEVPEAGVDARFYSDDEVKLALSGVKGTERAVVESPIRVLLFTGNKAHAWHNGEASTPRIKASLEADSRIRVDMTSDIEDLAKKKLTDYAAIVLNNYANWHDPKGLSEPAKQAFVRYLKGGGGLVVIHFANGAFHYSLPEAGESDWPEYRKIVRRVWDHHGREGNKSGHDAFGKYTVNLTKVQHPITEGLKDFEVSDELYYQQAGSEPIEPLTTAKSKDTKRDEPLAWTYEYDQARVFQTLLGHSEKTYDSYEPREMLRRAVAFVARRKVLSLPLDQEKLATPQAPAVALADGKFGKALDATKGGLLLKTKPEHADPPLTVECWTKLDKKDGFNILVASEEKSSATHWELYSYAGSGVCSVYLPGRGGEFKSEVDICDGKWHHVGFTLEAEKLRIFVDGKQVAQASPPALKDVKRTAGGDACPTAVGQLVEGSIGCAGLIDDVRITRGAVVLGSIPEKPLSRDDATTLLISFDDPAELSKFTASDSKTNVPKPTVSGTKGDHWGIEGVGFKWKEEDSRDDRWKDTDIGRFLASSLPLGTAAGTVAKGLSIRLGDKQEASVCYDTANCRLRAAWTGGFLKFTPARYGLIMSPLIDGEPQFLTTESPGWDAKEVRYRGMSLFGERVVLDYHVDGVAVKESPWIEMHDGVARFIRLFQVAPTDKNMLLRVASKLAPEDKLSIRDLGRMNVGILNSGGKSIVFASGNSGGTWRHYEQRGELVLEIPPHDKPRIVALAFGQWDEDQLKQIPAWMLGKVDQRSLPSARNAGSKKWTAKITTQGKRAADDGPYVVDTLTLPFDNPYKALFFTSGHDFLRAGPGSVALAVCTVHGDVWTVGGKEDLSELQWTRFATGLFQPLGLVAKHDGIYVLGRDQITRLQDTNKDGEADVYECVSNQMPTSPGGHDYTTCLETDADGNFYFLTANHGIWRLSPDGKTLDNLAGGLRNPNGLGVGPGPIITAAPQEGNWTPASYIAEAKAGDWFGYPGPKVTPERPLGWTQPLCFIPRRRDNSSGGQVWATSDRWGPLQDQLLHFSYGQCRQMLVLREVIKGQPQGGTVDMPQLFDSGAMRGRFSPYDGQLYVSGLRGWTTAATQDGCLQRVRYTGQPVYMPVKFCTLQNGVAITFSDALDRKSAQDLENYHLEQWNYRYAESYGSPDFKVSDPKQEGHDVVRVESATLLDDDRTVFLEIKDLKPVNQLTVGYALQSASGADVRHTIAYTIHNLNDERMDPTNLHRSVSPGRLTDDVEKTLKPGLIARVSENSQRDTIVIRLASFGEDRGKSSGPTAIRPLQVAIEGYLQVPLKGEYEFALEHQGESATFWINEQKVGLGDKSRHKVALHGGDNTVRLELVGGPRVGEGRVRLLWAKPGEVLAPIPPTALFHRSDDPELRKSQQVALGGSLLDSRHCNRCHDIGHYVRHSEPPRLGDRFHRPWLASWILDPQSLRNHPAMPQLLDAKQPGDRQAAANIAAFLTAAKSRRADEQQPDENLFEQGRDLYEDLNCLACHRLTPPGEKDPFDRVSLHFVNAKYPPDAVRSYLLKPHQHHANTRMPDFNLNAKEAAALSAYLQRAATGRVEPIVELAKADVKAGEAAFLRVQCANCHGRNEPPSSLGETVAVRKLTAGCLAAPESRGKAPIFAWGAGEREAVAAYLQNRKEILPPSPTFPAGLSRQLYRELRCYACHRRDGENGDRVAILDEESEHGRTPEVLPDLTWAGEKLKWSWIHKQLSGKVEERVRPWLKGRMPAFPAYADVLAHGLHVEHGVMDNFGKGAKADLAQIGEQLTLRDNLDCRQCHGIGKLEPMGDDKTKLAPGINFVHIKERLNHDYYSRFVLNPPAWDVTSRMPQLSPDGKTTKVTKFYDGDAQKQFEAIWNYIQSLEKE